MDAKKVDLLTKIELLREDLVNAREEEELIRISRKLDKLIVAVMTND